jgi:hypothetical protein
LFTAEKDNEKVLKEVTEHAGPTEIMAVKKLLGKLSKKVLHLLLQLPYQTTFFTVYTDNLFSNADLFHVLRAYSIAACGTARAKCRGWPKIFKSAINRKTTRLSYNQQYTTTSVEYSDVAAAVWQDKNLVQFLMTSHEPTADSFIKRSRPRNPQTAWLKRVVEREWGALGEKLMKHPTYSVDYNDSMGGVDQHSQFRSYCSTQLKASRTWMPLWFFLLDAAVVNAYIITREVYGGGIKRGGSKDPISNIQRSFRLRLAWLLILTGRSERRAHDVSATRPRGERFQRGNAFGGRTSIGVSYVTKATPLPAFRHSPGDHHLIRSFNKPQSCVYCRHLNRRDLAHKVRRSRLSCSGCSEDYPICNTCQIPWHAAVG